MAEKPFHTEEYRGATIKLYQDLDPTSPRECDNLGTMVCWHRRYILGDEMPKVGAETWLFSFLEEHNPSAIEAWDRYTETDEYLSAECTIEPALDWMLDMADEVAVILPLYLYDHSGIAMSTTQTWPFNCPWDAGQVGWIYVLHEDAKREYEWIRMTKKRLARLRDGLVGEVKEYNNFLTGSYCGFVVTLDDTDLDSCWGFSEHDFAVEEAKREIDAYFKHVLKGAEEYRDVVMGEAEA